jgi:hypothetical protein
MPMPCYICIEELKHVSCIKNTSTTPANYLLEPQLKRGRGWWQKNALHQGLYLGTNSRGTQILPSTLFPMVPGEGRPLLGSFF